MNRTVGVRVRRSVGRGVIFALGFGALSAAPQLPTPVSASLTALRVTRSVVEAADDPLPRQPRATVIIYVEATPPPPAVVPIAPAAPVRLSSARMSGSASKKMRA